MQHSKLLGVYGICEETEFELLLKVIMNFQC